MDISMPPDFPLLDFRAFGIAAQKFFPKLLSDEDLNDPKERLRHFQWSWQAVRYRYRLCSECTEEFSALFYNASDAWGGIDEELNYELEQCIYVFFVSGLSIFDSLVSCLYFFGNALQSITFPYVDKPKKITLNATTNAFAASFPRANVTQLLRELSKHPEFTLLEESRNILAHRLAGRRSVRSWGAGIAMAWMNQPRRKRGICLACTKRLRSTRKCFGDTCKRHLQAITALLVPLVSTSREFADQKSIS